MNLCVSESNCMTCRTARPQIDDCSQMRAHTCTHTPGLPQAGAASRPLLTTLTHLKRLTPWMPLMVSHAVSSECY